MGTPGFERYSTSIRHSKKSGGAVGRKSTLLRNLLLTDVHPDEKVRVFDQTEKLTAEGDVLDDEYRIIQPDGSVRWIRNRACLVRYAQGGLSVLTGLARDY